MRNGGWKLFPLTFITPHGATVGLVAWMSVLQRRASIGTRAAPAHPASSKCGLKAWNAPHSHSATAGPAISARAACQLPLKKRAVLQSVFREPITGARGPARDEDEESRESKQVSCLPCVPQAGSAGHCAFYLPFAFEAELSYIGGLKTGSLPLSQQP